MDRAAASARAACIAAATTGCSTAAAVGAKESGIHIVSQSHGNIAGSREGNCSARSTRVAVSALHDLLDRLPRAADG